MGRISYNNIFQALISEKHSISQATSHETVEWVLKFIIKCSNADGLSEECDDEIFLLLKDRVTGKFFFFVT